MITVQNLSISFQNNEVVRDVSFTISAAKITALVGQSGSGKSVTALAILQLLRGAQISGKIIFAGKNLLELDEQNLQKIRGKEIGLIFQDPNTSLNPLHKIGAQIAESVKIHNPKISKKDLQNRVAELLKMVDLESLTERLNDYPHQLSGGQKQRVMIAIALANNPKILIADEPTTALDVTVQNEILNLILRLKNELGIAVLFITHNLRAVTKIADEVIEMKEGKISSHHSHSSSLMLSIEDLGSSVARDHQVFNSSAKVEDSKILDVKNLSVIHAKKSFLKKEIFYANRDINFSLNLGKNLGVIGESGSGKSTLALALLNLISSQGEIKFFGQENDNKTWNKNNFELRRQVQIIFQDPFSSLNPRMLVKDIIEEGLLIHGSKASFEKRVGAPQGVAEDLLARLHLSCDILSRYPHQLSGGQRQRVAIARALILNPQILILDEPTSALDNTTQNEILKLLVEIQKDQEISYILISHDLEVVAQIADEIMVLKAGQIVELGKKSQIINRPKNSYTKTLISNF